MSSKKVYLSKEPAPDPIIRLVQGDADTQVITFRVPKMAGGVDLSEHQWTIMFHGENGAHDASVIGAGTLHGSLIEFDWTVPALVCDHPGRTWIMAEGVLLNADGTGSVWRSDLRCIYVAPAVNAEPGEIEHVLQPYQELIVTLIGECAELGPVVDELQERVDTLNEEIPEDILEELAGKANAVHTHDADDITGLEEAVAEAATGKQDKINDLDTIRAGAAAGATALQSVPVANDYDLAMRTNKAIPASKLDKAVQTALTDSLRGIDYDSTDKDAACERLGAARDTALSQLSGEIEDHEENSTIHVTADDKAKWDGIDSLSEDVTALYSDKQDVISDLDTIRSGAAAGATALQSVPIAGLSTFGLTKQYRNSNSYGIKFDDNGAFISGATADDIAARTNKYKPITSNNLNAAVTAALTDSNAMALDADAKAKACETIGALMPFKLETIYDYTITETGVQTVYHLQSEWGDHDLAFVVVDIYAPHDSQITQQGQMAVRFSSSATNVNANIIQTYYNGNGINPNANLYSRCMMLSIGDNQQMFKIMHSQTNRSDNVIYWQYCPESNRDYIRSFAIYAASGDRIIPVGTTVKVSAVKRGGI